MCRRVLRVAAVVCLLATATPSFAAPRHEDGGAWSRVLDRIVQGIRHLIPVIQDTIEISVPKP